jgi:hypothetical protein
VVNTADILIRTSDVWIGVSDATCEINFPEFWAAHATGPSFIAAVRGLQRAGQLLKREVVVDGSFRLVFVVDDHSAFDAPSRADLCKIQVVDLPSGEIVIRSGDPLVAPIRVLTVAPGQYEARFEWFLDQECDHYQMEPEAYPPGDGPDGVVTLRRVLP